MTFILSIIAFFLLFYFSRKLLNELFSLFYLTTRSRKISMHLLSFIVLPGTVIHEFSHLIMATLLHVKTGRLTIFPEFDQNQTIRAGSIMVAKSDPFRGTLIGLAPVLIGLTALGIIGHLFLIRVGIWLGSDPLQFAFYLLLLFEIGNTMFTSKSDLQDAVIVGFFFLGVGLLLHGLGVQISFVFPETFIEQLQNSAQSISMGLIGAAGIDIIVLAIIRMLVFVLRRLIIISTLNS